MRTTNQPSWCVRRVTHRFDRTVDDPGARGFQAACMPLRCRGKRKPWNRAPTYVGAGSKRRHRRHDWDWYT